MDGSKRDDSLAAYQEVRDVADAGIETCAEVDGTKLGACAFECRKACDLPRSRPVEIQPREGSAGLCFPVEFLERFEGDFVRIRFSVRAVKLIGAEQLVD